MQRTEHRARGISLREVLPECRFFSGDDVRITACCGDSRNVMPGDLFAAMVGSRQDGHDFAFEAVQRGAGAILAERPLPVDVPVSIVSNARAAFGRVCQALAGHPSRRLNVVGVTGTNGKTTTAMLIASILKESGRQVGVMSSLGYCDTERIEHGPETTPAAPELAQWLARMEAAGCSHAVVEVSSRALARYDTSGIEFDAAAVTNVRRDHLDLHGSVMNYRKTKGRLLRQLRPEGCAVLNADDAGSKLFLSKLENPVLTVGMRFPAELTAEVVERHRSEQTFLLCAGSETIPVRTQTIGDHYVANCLTAAAMGLVYGIDLPTVVRGLESAGQVPRRLERIECGQPFSVFVDCARTPDALAAGLKAVKRVTTGRVICVFGAPGDGDQGDRPLLGRVLERGAGISVIAGGDDVAEPLQVAHDLLDGYERPGRAHVIPDRAKAIHWALGEASPGDSVLIAGREFAELPDVDARHEQFDDRELASKWLYEMAAEEV